jgi:hypothetical protein
MALDRRPVQGPFLSGLLPSLALFLARRSFRVVQHAGQTLKQAANKNNNINKEATREYTK